MAKVTRKLRVSMAHHDGSEAKVSGQDFGRSIRDLPLLLSILLKNPVNMLLTAAGVSEGILISGFMTFSPKFMQNQFGLTAGMAAMLTGTPPPPSYPTWVCMADGDGSAPNHHRQKNTHKHQMLRRPTIYFIASDIDFFHVDINKITLVILSPYFVVIMYNTLLEHVVITLKCKDRPNSQPYLSRSRDLFGCFTN